MAKNRRKEARGQPIGTQGGKADGFLSETGKFPSWILWPVFAAWGFLIFKNYFARFPVDLNSLFVILAPGQYVAGSLKVLPGHFLNIFLAVVLLFAGFSLGRSALRFSGFKFYGRLEEAVFSIGTGFGLAAVFVFLLSILKLLYFWSVAVPCLLVFAAGVFDLLRHPLHPIPTLQISNNPPPAFGKADLAALSILVLAMLLNLAATLSPEIFYDALVYHLAVPNFYIIKHKIDLMPYNFYSNLPFTHGMLYAAALLLKDEILAKFINYSAGIITAAAVLAIGIRYFSWRAGLWGAMIFYTVVHAMLSYWSAGTESLITCFSTLALYAVLNSGDEEPRWLWLAAVFSGLAMGVKYTGFFPVLGVMLMYAYAAGRSGLFAVFKNLSVFTVIASLLVGPWLVKNYIYTGNPFFPFLIGLLGAGPHSDPQKLQSFISAASQLDGFQLKYWLMCPWNITMGNIPNSAYFSPLFIFLLPLVFLLVPCSVGSMSSQRALRGLWIYFLTVWGGWSLSSTMVRFLMPAYPAAGLIMAGYVSVPGHKWLKSALKAAILAVCLTGVYYSAVTFYLQGRWRPLIGMVTKEDYLSRTQPTYPYSGYAAIKFINEKLPENAKVLMVGDERSFYLKRDFLVSSVYDKTAIVEYAAASKNGDEMYARLKADGITHMMLNLVEGIRLGKSYHTFYFTPASLAVFNDFWARHVKQLYANDEADGGRFMNRTAVYEITPGVDSSSTPLLNLVNDVIMKNILGK
jgi:hypothetical protein